MIEVRNLDFSYGPKKVIEGLNLTINKGAFFGLLGPNGSGKTTLFRMLSTLICPPRDTIFISGIEATAHANEIRSLLGVVFQHPSLDVNLTAFENLYHQGMMYGLRGDPLKEICKQLLAEFHLQDSAHERVIGFSGGMQRKLEIAKAVMHKPNILLMDEPSTGLDPAARRDFWKLIADLRRETGMTVLFTTHLLEEAETCDEVTILHHGKRVAQGRPNELKRELKGEVVSVYASEPEHLAEKIRTSLHLQTKVLNGCVRIETEAKQNVIRDLMDRFSLEISDIHLRKPSLEDLFFQKTGERFE